MTEENATPTPPTPFRAPTTRRAVVVGGAALAATGAFAAAGLSSSAHGTAGDGPVETADTVGVAAAAVCSLNARVTEGPYSLEGALVRVDNREDKAGVEVRYKLTVVDTAKGCAPLAGALVEIWHCDSLGEYSGFVGNNGHPGADNGTFLRGGQLTGSNGVVNLVSIWPGHYRGRAVHTHLRVHTDVTLTGDTYTGGEIVHTGQLFYDPAINATIQASSPYKANTTRETHLDDDSIYDGAGATSGLLTLTPLGSTPSAGYTATLTMGVDSTA
ncbi:intradiol ring-cleavage dioxygenase [Streptomyces sp. NPDC088400]|uniref:intradiol ring-cleavage dioxygenase n=1 Tax=Streptomyces sp. NPDC088400 TaxID=3365861 RepID=UPI0038216FD8